MTLHDELGLLADTAPRPTIDHTLWDQGRALRRRDRLVASAVVLALVVIVGGLASLVLGPPQAFSPADDLVPEGAIPSRIVGLPSSVTGPLETDLAIGRASVAYISDNGLPVVIDARDGTYHLLDLPGWSTETDGLALSPNGHRLAWPSSDRDGAVLAVLDLETGDLSQIVVYEGVDVDVRTIAWSPDSSGLGVIGDSPVTRTVVGRAEVTAERGEIALMAVKATQMSLAVSNGGTVAVGRGDGGMTMVLPGGTVALGRGDGGMTMVPDGAGSDVPARVLDGTGPAAFSPEGEWLALATGPGTSSRTLQLAGGRAMAEHPFPEDTIGKAVVLPLGWLDERLQLLLVQPTDGGAPELVVTTPTVDETSTWRRSVASLDAGALPNLTLAVDLIPDLDGTSSQQLTHDFGEPDWPGQRDISWIIGLGVAGALTVLYGLRWLWRRRTGLF